MKLISMTDFVIKNQKNTQSSAHSFFICVQYANFLKEPLELGMFVPCDRNGNVLEEPERVHFSTNFDYKAELSIYLEALERCLFDDFKVTSYKFIHNTYHYFIEDKNGFKPLWNFNNKWEFYLRYKTIEDLVKYNLQLTTSAQKKIDYENN